MMANPKKAKRTYAQVFMDKLTALAKDGQQLIGNKTLREELGWDEDKYKRTRTALVDQNKIIVGRGKGGSVGLASAPGTKGLNVFISYSHVDENDKNELLKHLAPLRRLNLIEAWHDRKLKAGEEWDKVISTNLEKADVVLLLVSTDFINSSYCYDIELERALERHAAGEARVIPVILRPCMWKQTEFAKLQALPNEPPAVSLWKNSNEARLNIAEGIRNVAEELLESQ